MRSNYFVLLLLVTFTFFASDLKAQVHVGVYHSGFINQVGVGTDNEKPYFGELRVLATDLIDFPNGVELLGHKNFKTGDWVNLHAGLMFGLFFEGGSAKAGIPLGLTFKPIQEHKNFAILMEATPNVNFGAGDISLRSNIGLRYTFRKD